MTKLLRAFAILLFAALAIPLACQAAPRERPDPTPAELEFEHTKLIYDGYVGQRDEQKANMLELTIGRLERTVKLHKDSGVRNLSFEQDMRDFGESLLAVRHMMRARDASRAGKESVVRQELTQACRHADQTTYLDPRLQKTCSDFRKNGSIHMT